MTTTIYLENIDLELEIDDPENLDHWKAALTDYCDNYAQNHYSDPFYNDSRGDVSAEFTKALSEAICEAIVNFRQEPIAVRSWKEAWHQSLNCSLLDHLGEYVDEDEHIHQSLSKFQELYEALDDAMSEIEGPVCCLDQIWETLRDYVIDEMGKRCTSTIFDFVGHSRIELCFKPGVKPDSHDTEFKVNDLDINGPDKNMLSLLNLYRLPVENLLPHIDIDHTDIPTVKRWYALSGLTFEHPPLIEPEGLIEITNNASGWNHAMWFGRLTLDDIKKVNFLEPVKLEGGVMGLHDSLNGSGYMHETEGYVLFGPDDHMDVENGYGVDNVHGFTSRTYEASMKNSEEKPKNKPRLSMSLDV